MRFWDPGIWGARLLAISFLIPSLMHIPLPQPDFHNVRHHDAAGENCVYHDHLLRWHPKADQNADMVMLHWHWLLPGPNGLNEEEDAPKDNSNRLAKGPWFQHSVADSLDPDWSCQQSISSDLPKSFGDRLIPAPVLGIDSLAWYWHHPSQNHCSDRVRQQLGGSARAALHLLAQRWNC